MQNLQRDKEDLERALGGLKARIQDNSGPPLAVEAAKKQQIMLERELSRVHQLLAENSKVVEVPSRSLSSIFCLFCFVYYYHIRLIVEYYLYKILIQIFISVSI